MWLVTFDETGGYDCISSAYTVRNSATDEKVTIDGLDFDWAHAWEDNPVAKARMRIIADAIATALNQQQL